MPVRAGAFSFTVFQSRQAGEVIKNQLELEMFDAVAWNNSVSPQSLNVIYTVFQM